MISQRSKKIKLSFEILRNITLPRSAEQISHDLYDAVKFENEFFYRIVRPNYFLNYPNNWLSLNGKFLSSAFGWLKPMKIHLNQSGRAMIELQNNGKRKESAVARWICLLFCDIPARHIGKPLHKLFASHIVNHDGTNDCTSNLVWETRSENMARETGKKNPKTAATLSRSIIVTALDGSRSETFDGATIAGELVGACGRSLSHVASGKRNKAFAKIWNCDVTAAYNNVVPNGVVVKVNIEFSHGIIISDDKPWFVTTDGQWIKPNKRNWSQVRNSDQRFKIQGKFLNIYKILAGTILGTTNEHYPKEFSLEYFLVQGEDRDALSVDHIDGDHSNNKIENLRWATPSIQGANTTTNVGVRMWPASREFNAETDVFGTCTAAARKYDIANKSGVADALLRGQTTYQPRGGILYRIILE